MRIGFVTQLLWPRYGEFWTLLLGDLGADLERPQADAVLRALPDKRLQEVPGTAFKLAVAQAISLQHCDLLVVPDLNPGADVARGGGQDPWIADFPGALAASVSGLPPVAGVPASLHEDLERRAIEVMSLVGQSQSAVHRTWERYRGAARTPTPQETPPDSRAELVGLIGQPWLMTDALAALARQEDVRLAPQHHLAPERLRAEGLRADSRLVPTDAEVLGAARLLGRRGSVTRLRMVVDETSGADVWLEQQVRRHVRKPLEVVRLSTLAPPEELLQALHPG